MLDTFSLDSLKSSFKSNKKFRIATYCIGGLFLSVLLYFSYRQFIWKPANEKSKDCYWISLNYMKKGEIDKAIPLLITAVKKYDGYDGGEIAQYLLGKCYMSKGQFVKALNSLKEANPDDTYISVFCIGLQGDCNVELKKYDAALKLYEEASIAGENNLTTPMYLFKAGAVAEQLKKYSVASEHYTRIRDEFPEYASQNIFTIDKYIARVSSNKAK